MLSIGSWVGDDVRELCVFLSSAFKVLAGEKCLDDSDERVEAPMHCGSLTSWIVARGKFIVVVLNSAQTSVSR